MARTAGLLDRFCHNESERKLSQNARYEMSESGLPHHRVGNEPGSALDVDNGQRHF